MSEKTTAWKLKEDTRFGKKGDWIDIIADHGNVVIIQGLKSNRFSINKDLLDQGELPTPVEETIKKIEAIAENPNPIKKPKVAKPLPLGTATQQSIFK